MGDRRSGRMAYQHNMRDREHIQQFKHDSGKKRDGIRVLALVASSESWQVRCNCAATRPKSQEHVTPGICLVAQTVQKQYGGSSILTPTRIIHVQVNSALRKLDLVRPTLQPRERGHVSLVLIHGCLPAS